MKKTATKTWTRPAGTLYNIYSDFLEQKHLMIAGASGSGKSVLLNGIILNALYKFPGNTEDSAQFIFIDAKRVELSAYKHLPHTLFYASDPQDMIDALQYAMDITERRYKEMEAEELKKYAGSDIYVIIDEFADLMTTDKRRAKPLVQRLAQIGRAAKIHIILCTQCPLSTIIPTEIKVNFDSIIGLHTASARHSRNILEVTGCEQLPAYGECLYIKPGHDIQHFSGIPLFTDDQISERVKWWTDQVPPTPTKKTGLFSRLFCTKKGA